MLGWIGEQYGVWRDHLALLLGRAATEPTQAPGRLGETTMQKLVQRWKRQGLIETATLEHGQPSWVWLIRKGLEQLELDYRYEEPKLQSLPHLYAVNQVRLWVAERLPEALWCSERHLNSERPFTHRQAQAEVLPGILAPRGGRRTRAAGHPTPEREATSGERDERQDEGQGPATSGATTPAMGEAMFRARRTLRPHTLTSVFFT